MTGAELFASNEFERAHIESSMVNRKPTAKSNRPSESLAANDTEDSIKEDEVKPDVSGTEAKMNSAKSSKKSVENPQADDCKTEVKPESMETVEKLIDTTGRTSRKRTLSQMTGGEVVEIASKSKKSCKKLKLSDAYATWKKSLAKTPSQESKKEEVEMVTPPQEDKVSGMAEVQTEEVAQTTEADKPDQPVDEALPEEVPADVAEGDKIPQTDAVEQVTSKVKDLSLKKTAEEEPSISHSELVNNLPADSQPKEESKTVVDRGTDEADN